VVKLLLSARGGGAKGPDCPWFVCFGQPGSWEELYGRAESSRKPFDISKREVWEAYLKVESQKGCAGGGRVHDR